MGIWMFSRCFALSSEGLPAGMQRESQEREAADAGQRRNGLRLGGHAAAE